LFRRSTKNIKSLNEVKSNNKDIINESLTNVNESANKANSLLDKILELINNNSSSNNNLTYQSFIDNYDIFFNSLTLIQKGAFVHILLCICILFCIIDILVAYYNNKLITYFNIENKYPKLK
jgi:hypothetical protein